MPDTVGPAQPFQKEISHSLFDVFTILANLIILRYYSWSILSYVEMKNATKK